MKTAFTYGGPNPYGSGQLIELRQRGEDRAALFDVAYGAQLDCFLPYAMACRKLGEALMHHLACESLISNEGK